MLSSRFFRCFTKGFPGRAAARRPVSCCLSVDGSAGDRSWAQQLQALRPGEITLTNEAVPGATSASLLSGGQAAALAQLAHKGAIDYAVLMVGANDITANLPTILAGNPQPFVS